jgi:hypothetical protein
MRHTFETPTLTDCGSAIVSTLGSQAHSVESLGKLYASGTDTKVNGVFTQSEATSTNS